MGRLIGKDETFTLGMANSAMGYLEGNLIPWIDVSLKLSALIKNGQAQDTRHLEGPGELLEIVNQYVDAMATDAASKIKQGHFR